LLPGFDRRPQAPYHARAMRNPLRERRAPSEWAASGQVIDFAEQVGNFKRLAEIIGKDLETLDPEKRPANWRDAPVTGCLSFGFADAQERVPALEGSVTATVDAVCQRCLEPFRLPLNVELRLLFTAGSNDSVEGEVYEVWELEDDRLRPLDLVEEALVMAMPLAALHVDAAACKAPTGEKPAESSTTRPFASLRAQMEDEN
jgi:uncharacterized metal-binding protein YceD (DUF177 family)